MFLLWLRQLPQCGIGPLLQFPYPLRAGPVLLTLLFLPLVPSSYRVSHDSIYSFPLVRYSCLLSAGILHALLSLKVCSWCIHGERCTSSPPAPPPPWNFVHCDSWWLWQAGRVWSRNSLEVSWGMLGWGHLGSIDGDGWIRPGKWCPRSC